MKMSVGEPDDAHTSVMGDGGLAGECTPPTAGPAEAQVWVIVWPAQCDFCEVIHVQFRLREHLHVPFVSLERK